MPTRPPTTNTRHRSAALALAALAALAGLGTVAGCASDPPPTPAASIVLPTNPTSEPTPSDANPPVSATEQPATATSTPSTAPAGLSPIPPGARQRTASGAEAFVRYYIAESNRTMTHPRLGVMKPLEMPGCRACGNLERIVEDLINHDVHYTAPPTLISSMGEATEDPGTGDYVLSATLRRPRVSLVDSKGRTDMTVGPDEGVAAYRLRWRGSTWAIVEISKVT